MTEGDMFGSEESEIEVVEQVAETEIVPEEEHIEPETQPKSEPVLVPLAALHEVRDEVKRLKAEADQRNRQSEPVEPIDPYSDLEGALSKQEADFQHKLYEQKAQMSRRFAEIQHGPEVVQAALDWALPKCDSDPAFNQQVYASADPVEFAIAQYNRDQIASTVTMDDFKAFQAWKQSQSQPQAAPLAQPAPTAVIPKSIVSAQSAGAPSMPKTDPIEEKLNSMF